MLLAKDSDGKWIHALNANKQQTYYCPDCQEIVMLKCGKKVHPHFAHYATCQRSLLSENETIEHLQGKQMIYDMCCACQLVAHLEMYLPDLKQRPDIFITYGTRQIAVEFQCSRLAMEVMQQRTKGYQQAGIEVIWILGKQNARCSHHHYWYAKPELVCYLFDEGELFMKYNNQKIPITLTELLSTIRYEKKVSIQKGKRTNKIKQSFLKAFYQLGGKIYLVPETILQQQDRISGLYHVRYELLSYIWLYCDGKQQDGAIAQHIITLVNKGVLRMLIMPCVDTARYSQYLVMYGIKQLLALGVVSRNRKGLLEKNAKI